ncbi:MAG: PAS domain-containing protein [Clostridia bacterium]|nr:hypothetical protein [Bacillota bacterium]MBO2521351.1 hypothetical protein [Bacillota bacterium]
MKGWLSSRLVRQALATHAAAALLAAAAVHLFSAGAAGWGWAAALASAAAAGYGIAAAARVPAVLRLLTGMVQRLDRHDSESSEENGAAPAAAAEAERLAVDEEALRLAAALQRFSARRQSRFGQLAHERATVEAVLESLADPVIAVDPSLSILFANRPALDVFPLAGKKARERVPAGPSGMPAGEAVGRDVREVIQDQECIALIQKAVAERTEVSATLHLGASPAEMRTYHVVISPIRTPGEGAAGAVCVFHDQTELLRLERIRSDFVANVSHELRTPLTAVHGFIETLQDGSYLNPERTKRYLEIMHGETTRLIAIINDLLHLSRLEGPAGALAREPLDLAALAHEVTELVRKRAEAKGLRLAVDAVEGRELPEVLGDGAAIRQALLNLVDNAVKYTESGGSVTVTVEPAADPGPAGRGSPRPDGAGGPGAPLGVRVTVADTGVGIPEDQLDRIFERFYRVDKARSRKEGGTGLGLSIVKHTIERHKGRLGVQSQLGKGTRIWFWLPAEGAGPGRE